jgi:hypothetical protein
MNQMIPSINKMFRRLLVIFLGCAVLNLVGCQLAYFLAGNGEDKALYDIPRSDRVLVLVDSAANSPMTMQAITGLIDSVNSQLYQNKAADQLVPSFRVMQLERSNPVAYKQMGIADIAAALHADLVVYVFVNRFDVLLDAAQEVSHGDALGLVKIVDNGGKRLWPDDVTEGYPVSAHIQENFTADQSSTDVQNQLIAQLSVNIALLFYDHPASNTQEIKPGDDQQIPDQ